MRFLRKLFNSLGDSRDNSYRDYICTYCDNEFRVEGNGGLVLGCWPNCPECGMMAEEKK